MRLCLTFSVFLLSVAGYSQNWSWAKGPDGIHQSVLNRLTTDQLDNVINVGLFVGPMIVGTTTVTTTMNDRDGFIVKYNSTGTLLWVKQIHGVWFEECTGVTTDSNNNIYVTGWASSAALTVDNTTITGRGIFIIKFDPNGTYLWSKTLPSQTFVQHSIATDTGGNILLTGEFTDSLIIGSKLYTSKNPEIYLLKLDPAGNELWSKTIGGVGSHTSSDICTDASSNFYITGFFSGDTLTVDNSTFLRSGIQDFFVLKFNSSGTLLWGNTIATDAYTGFGPTIASDGINVVVAGTFTVNTIPFGITTLTNTSTNTPLPMNSFVAKYSSQGTVLWAKLIGGKFNQVNALTTLSNGDIVATGYSSPSKLTIDNLVFSDTLATGTSIFVCRYTSAGSAQQLIVHGFNGNSNVPYDVHSDSHDHVFVGGFYHTALTLESTVLINNSNYNHFFVGKIGSFSTVGLHELSVDNNWFLFPNPSSGEIAFSTDLKSDQVTIYSPSGQKVWESNSTDFNGKIDLNFLPKGLYIVEARNKKGTFRKQKVILE